MRARLQASKPKKTRKRKSRKQNPKRHPKVNQGRTYTEVLGRLCADMNLDASKTTVLRLQLTKECNMLLRLSEESDKAAFV